MINTASTFFPFPTDVTRPAGRRAAVRVRPEGFTKSVLHPNPTLSLLRCPPATLLKGEGGTGSTGETTSLGGKY